jgi:hypothetical protein
MKKLIMGILFLICAVSGLSAQEYRIPDIMDIEDDWWVTGVAFIGWSRDGKAAFITYDEVDGRGGTYITVIIFDTVEDIVLWDGFFDTYDEETYEFREDDFEAYFHSETVQNHLRDAGIIQSSPDFRYFPFEQDGWEYSCTVDAEYYDNVYNMIGDLAYRTYRVVISRTCLSGNGRTDGQKTIHTEEFSEVPVWLFGAGVVGCVKSPYENRVLIIFSELQADFEEPQAYYKFTGAHLNIGFRDVP